MVSAFSTLMLTEPRRSWMGTQVWKKGSSSMKYILVGASLVIACREERAIAQLDSCRFHSERSFYFWHRSGWMRHLTHLTRFSRRLKFTEFSWKLPVHRMHRLASRGRPMTGMPKGSHDLIPMTSSGTQAIPRPPTRPVDFGNLLSFLRSPVIQI